MMEALASPPAAANMALVQRVRSMLWVRADASRAVQMQAYMKSGLPFLGVPPQGVRAVCRGAFAAVRLDGPEAWRGTALALWREATYREERYAALELLVHPLYRAYRTLDVLPLCEELVVTGAWWDTVDTVAGCLLGELLGVSPRAVGEEMRRWARDRNVWKRRAAILCQVWRGGETDPGLLFGCIEASLGERSFYLRKAIGVALRHYAGSDPGAVTAYLEANAGRLSAESKREAVRRLRGHGRPCDGEA